MKEKVVDKIKNSSPYVKFGSLLAALLMLETICGIDPSIKASEGLPAPVYPPTPTIGAVPPEYYGGGGQGR